MDEYQEFELLKKLVKSAKESRTQISKFDSDVYKDVITRPPTSHFYVNKNIEKYLQWLELNFFVHKYREMADRDGTKSSIYALNYGLCKYREYLLGKAYRSYGIPEVLHFTHFTITISRKNYAAPAET